MFSSPKQHYNKSLDRLLECLCKKKLYKNGFISDYHRKWLSIELGCYQKTVLLPRAVVSNFTSVPQSAPAFNIGDRTLQRTRKPKSHDQDSIPHSRVKKELLHFHKSGKDSSWGNFSRCKVRRPQKVNSSYLLVAIASITPSEWITHCEQLTNTGRSLCLLENNFHSGLNYKNVFSEVKGKNKQKGGVWQESDCTLWSHPQLCLIFSVQTPPAVAYLVAVLMGADTNVRPVNWAGLLVALSLLLQKRGPRYHKMATGQRGKAKPKIIHSSQKKEVLGLTASEWSLVGNKKPWLPRKVCSFPNII